MTCVDKKKAFKFRYRESSKITLISIVRKIKKLVNQLNKNRNKTKQTGNQQPETAKVINIRKQISYLIHYTCMRGREHVIYAY